LRIVTVTTAGWASRKATRSDPPRRWTTTRVGAGKRTIRWNGLYGNGVRAYTGSYVASVQAANSFGPTELERRFLVKRARR
jgi:hypothetical protein